MTCPCDDIKRKMPKCDAGTPPVIKVDGGETPVLFHTVNIPASIGNIETLPPTVGAYRNARVYYEADEIAYLYDSDGIPQILVAAGGGGKVNSVNGKIGNVVLNADDVGAPTKAELKAAIDNINSELDRTVVYDLEMTSTANSVTFTEDKIDVVTGVTSQEQDIIPTASTTTAGTISASEYVSIKNSQDRLNALEGGSVAVSGLSATPTQGELTSAWLNTTGYDELINRASIYDSSNLKVWTYYTNDTTWYESGSSQVTIDPFTNMIAGTILGSATDGNISANLDGTGTVSGWATLKTEVAGKVSASDLATVATTGAYSDLIGTPSLATVATSGLYSDLTGTPALATVATSGQYSDLTGTPTIPTSFSDLSGTIGTSQIDDGAVTASKLDLATVIEKIYPVGSIYMSTNNVSPASFIGGTWVQIEDTFLLSAGQTYTAGNTGGEATHTLTIAEMPSHTHSWNGYASLDTDAGDGRRQAINTQRFSSDPTQSGTINNTGGGQAHNNMPPYLVVYMWKRTA